MNLDGMRNVLVAAGVAVIVFVIWMLASEGCAPVPATSGYPNGDDIVVAYADDSPQALSSPCGLACKHLAELKCPEGGAVCYRSCVRQVALERVPIACWTKAPTVADVRACGPQLRCLPQGSP